MVSSNAVVLRETGMPPTATDAATMATATNQKPTSRVRNITFTMISALLGPPVRGRRSESMRSDSAEHWTETGGASKVGRRLDYRGRVCPRAEDVDR